MKSRTFKRILLPASLAGVAGIIAWQGFALREPRYEGRPLSFWLKAYRSDDGRARIPDERAAMQHKADEALGKAGTNAIPVLFGMIRAKDSRLKIAAMNLLKRQRIVKIQFTSAVELNYQGWTGFYKLGLGGRDVLPQLMEIANEGPTPSRFAVAEVACISRSAKEAIPPLLQWATNADPWVRYEALPAFTYDHDEPEKVVPLLTVALRDPSPSVQNIAIQALGTFGPHARSAVPALLDFLNTSQNGANNYDVSVVLKEIDPEAAARAGMK
jgi:hypothetical protein